MITQLKKKLLGAIYVRFLRDIIVIFILWMEIKYIHPLKV